MSAHGLVTEAHGLSSVWMPVTLATLQKAATAIGREVRVELV